MATAVTAAALLTSATLFAGGEAGGAIADANETGSGASDALAALKEKFFLAVRELDEDRFLSLVKENPDVADSIFDDGESLLGKAAWVGSLEAVRILLSRSADPDQGDYRPLQSALLSIDLIKSTKIIVELLNAGADYNIKPVKHILYLIKIIMLHDILYKICDVVSFDPNILSLSRTTT